MPLKRNKAWSDVKVVFFFFFPIFLYYGISDQNNKNISMNKQEPLYF